MKKHITNLFIKKQTVHLFIAFTIVCAWIFSSNVSATLQGDLHAHDPSAIRVGNVTYVFSTGFEGGPSNGSITVRKTTDQTMYSGWIYVGTVWNSVPSWITARLGSTPPNIWAPDINYWNGKYYLYYGASIWGTSTATMGLLTATNIEGPWTDQGEVTNVNYPIDPNIVWAGSAPYITWGSWSGIYMRQVDPVTGKLSTSNTTMTKIATGIENSAILPYNGYFYLFGSKGSCCSGVNSTYYTVVARATSITGPYYDANGTAMTSGGGTGILYGLKGYTNEIGTGGADWFQVGSDYYLVHHFYNGANNGSETFNIRQLFFESGWVTVSQGINGGAITQNTPSGYTWCGYEGQSFTLSGTSDVAYGAQGSYKYLTGKTGAITFNTTTFGGDPIYGVAKCGYFKSTSSIVSNGTYKLTNRATGKCLDNLGVTTDGSTIAQWTSGGSPNQQWVITYSGGYYKLSCVTGSKYLDGLGHTSDGSTVGQLANSSSTNQQWSITAVGSYYKIINRTNGKCLDTGGGTADGSIMQFWYNGASYNQQWTLTRMKNEPTNLEPEDQVSGITFYPNPVQNTLFVNGVKQNEMYRIFTVNGKLVKQGNLSNNIDVSSLLPGMYFIKFISESKPFTVKFVKE